MSVCTVRSTSCRAGAMLLFCKENKTPKYLTPHIVVDGLRRIPATIKLDTRYTQLILLIDRLIYPCPASNNIIHIVVVSLSQSSI